MKNNFNTVGEALVFIKQNLVTEYDRHEAQTLSSLILEYILDKNIAYIRAHTEAKLSNSEINRIQKGTFDLLNHKPLQHITGVTTFFNLSVRVTKDVLIPRPETEELVDWIINDNPFGRRCTILDVGTGSGCIAIALAKNIETSLVYAMDISPRALAVAKENAARNQVNIHFLEVDVLNPVRDFTEIVDFIVSNPPYIPASEVDILPRNVKEHEPGLALFVPDKDPLVFYKAIERNLSHNLKAGGAFYFEIHEHYGDAIAHYFKQTGYQITVKTDINGKQRMAKAVKLTGT